MSEIGRDQNNQEGTTPRPPPPSSLAHEGHDLHHRHDGALPSSSNPGGHGLAAGSGGAGNGGALGLSRRVAEAMDIKALLEQNTDEVDNLMRALEGSYVKPGVGGEAG